MASGGPGSPGLEYKDYYAVLGVPRAASQAEVKKAFRKLARQHHPDAKPGDSAAERKFKEINEANEVLSDPAKRQQYDQLGANWEAISQARAAGSGRHARSTGSAAATSATNSGPPTPASSPTSSASSSARAWPPTGPARRPVAARPRRAARWASTTSWPGWGSTSEGRPASGHGASGGHAATSGHATHAAGSTRSRPAPRPPAHEATAEITLDEAYHGTTRLVEVEGKRLEIKIPKGAESGTRIKLTGRGPGGGDLIVVVRMLPDARFTRRGADLERDLPLTLEEALLGDEVPVETLKGRVLLKIPPGTQPGKTFRLSGRGMPRFKGEGYGDLYVKSRVVLPTALSEEAQDAARIVPRPRRPTQPTQRRLTVARSKREPEMQLDRFTQKAQEAIIAAQAAAQRLDSPVLDAEHILSALVEPDDGDPRRDPSPARRRPARVPRRAGGHPRPPGEDPGRLAVPRSARPADHRAGRGRGQAPRRRVRLDGAPPARDRRARWRGPDAAREPRRRSRGAAPGAGQRAWRPAGHLAQPGEHLRRAREVRPRPDDRGTGRPARPGHRPRRRDPARHPGPVAPDQEQPGADRRARRRQDRHRRGARPADRPRRRPRGAQGQARRLARPRRAHRRRQVPRRVRGAAEGRPQGDQGRRRPGHPVHRRAPHGRRRRCGRGRDGRLQPAQADARPRRAAHDRRDDARRVPQAHREGRRARAPLPADPDRPAVGRGDDLDPARAARAVRGPPRRPDHQFGAGRRGDPVRPLHLGALPARQGDRPRRRGRLAAADADRFDADRARRARAPPDPARDRARGAAQGDRRRLEGTARRAREGARRHRGERRAR